MYMHTYGEKQLYDEKEQGVYCNDRKSIEVSQIIGEAMMSL